MTDTSAPDEATRRFRPNHAVIGLGVLVALFTAASGVASLVNDFHDDSPITREVFANIPGPLKLAFYSVIPMLIVYGGRPVLLPSPELAAGRPRRPVHEAGQRQAAIR